MNRTRHTRCKGSHTQETRGFDEGKLICERNFGKATIKGSHRKYKTGWADDPTVNIQSFKGKMKPYQQKQLLSKIIRKENDER